MKFVEVSAAKEFAYTRFPDPILNMAVNAVLDNVPAADVVPVVHGFNTYDHDDMFECSICGFSDCDTMTSDGKYNYCPGCGARLDGGRRTDDNS